MVLDVFSNLEIKVKQSVDYIELLKTQIHNLQLKNKSLQEKLNNIYSIQKSIENKNLLIQEERIQWKKKLKMLLEKVNSLE
ncbi:cell division protein ZapB [Buchnera aphidicola]|uniref:cell division protein ZapB n=1 Tax=Buchnera aphidicola TaxID=9 RepID=UPI00094D62E8|nr:cell division protein ZapB [Buchnera aphidicola]